MTFGLLGGASPKTASGGSGGSSVIIGDDAAADIKEIKYTVWLDEYKSFGEESHVFNNKDNWAELMQSNAALNDSTISATAFNFLIENDIDPLIAMGNVYGTGIDFKQYSNFADIVANVENVQKIINHPVLSKMVYGYQLYANTLYSENSAIWDIMNSELLCSIEETSAFADYVTTLSTVTSQASLTNGYYFLVSVDTTGRNYSSSGVNKYYDGHSGASYVNASNQRITIRDALLNRSGANWSRTGSDPMSHQIGKIATDITLVDGNGINFRVEEFYDDTRDVEVSRVTFKSTAHYKILHN